MLYFCERGSEFDTHVSASYQGWDVRIEGVGELRRVCVKAYGSFDEPTVYEHIGYNLLESELSRLPEAITRLLEFVPQLKSSSKPFSVELNGITLDGVDIAIHAHRYIGVRANGKLACEYADGHINIAPDYVPGALMFLAGVI
jgi:hypothetical protein